MAKVTDKQVIFALVPMNEDGKATIIVGLTRAAWHHMELGNHQAFSLENAIGLPLNFVLFTGKDHASVMGVLEAGFQARGQTVDDRRRDNFMPEPQIRDEMIAAAIGEAGDRGLTMTKEDAAAVLRAGMMAP